MAYLDECLLRIRKKTDNGCVFTRDDIIDLLGEPSSSESGDDYYASSLSAINTKEYQLTGWYDDQGYSAGQQIRVIVAVEK